MRGTRRVLTFCLLTTVLPAILIIIPLYLRNIKYADVMYKVHDSDIIQIHQGQSSVFCKKHSLKMNTTFNAFQMKGWPEVSDKKKHIQLKKSMILPDDTLEYWGFFLLKGAEVELKACSRYEGSKILVVKGDKILNTCGILDDKKERTPNVIYNQGHVVITLETPNKERDYSKTNHEYDEAIENNAEENFTDDNDLLLLRESLQKKMKVSQLITKLNMTDSLDFDKTENKESHIKHKREAIHLLHNPNTILDTGVNHGGNAFNNSKNRQEDSSVSSFENGLQQCYSGNILLNDFFPYSPQCKSTKYLEKTTTLKVTHEVLQDGYYYYIFYSDNDFVQNDLHVIFDIYKPTFQYSNISDTKMCINKTYCEFEINLFSDESVIVEVPTKDGIEYGEDNLSILTSICQPRMSVYIFFPVAVLLLILLFAFL